MSQTVLTASNDYYELDEYLKTLNCHKIFLVCDSAYKFLKISSYFDSITERLGINIIKFDDFQPNPLYESVVKGVKLFNEFKCDVLIAVGGGSTIDVAKCIKLYSNLNHSENYLKQTIIPNAIPFLAVPTTAGTGSEATKYAVIYYEGAKQSVTHDSCIPSTVLFDISALETLPEYQKKSTMLDAFCHAIESFWSVNSTDESKEYSKKAINLILANYKAYLQNEFDGNKNMLLAANYAGKAINITQTTAGHAMCYKLTSLYGIAHGHAAALCVSVLWPYMIAHTNLCFDPRGSEYLDKVFEELASVMNTNSALEAAQKFIAIFNSLDLKKPVINQNDFEILKKSVNPVRLKNNPVALDEEIIDYLYHQIMEI